MKTQTFVLILSTTLFSSCNGSIFNEKPFKPSTKDYSFMQEYKVTEPANLKITTSGGNISASGRNDNTIEVTYIVSRRGQVLDVTLNQLKEIAEVEIIHDDSNLEIKIKRTFERNISVGFIVKTPAKTSAKLNTSGGNIVIENILGKHSVNTSGGNIDLNKITGNVDANTSGGNISIGNSSADFNASTSGGNISMENINGGLHVSTSGGNIDAKNIKHGLTAQTSGGNISVKNTQGTVDVNTSGGGIELSEISGSVKAITSGGDISADILQLQEKLELETSGGSVNATVPKGLGLDLDLSGDQVNTALENFTGTSRKDRIMGKMNGGGIVVHLSTSGGAVTLNYK